MIATFVITYKRDKTTWDKRKRNRTISRETKRVSKK